MHSTMQVLSTQPSPDAEQTPLKPKTGSEGGEADVLKNRELPGSAFWDLHTQAAIT